MPTPPNHPYVSHFDSRFKVIHRHAGGIAPERTPLNQLNCVWSARQAMPPSIKRRANVV